MRRLFFILLFAAFGLQFSAYVNADTITMNDGKELKGIVVEDYADRITLSTVDGEIQVKKADIRQMYFDSDEDNLLMMAKLAQDRKSYNTAFAYYNKVLKINPDSKAAKDGIVYVQGYLYRKNELMKEYDVARREEFERYGTVSGAGIARQRSFKEAVEHLKKSLGMTLIAKDIYPAVDSIEKNSAAAAAGVKKGDLLVAVWGRLTGYMPLNDVLNLMIDKPLIEIKCTIERTVDVRIEHGSLIGSPENLIGSSFSMEFDGLTISGVKDDSPSSAVGLKQGDLITAIDGKPTRYMPLKKAVELIKDSKKESIPITLRRDLTLWRKE